MNQDQLRDQIAEALNSAYRPNPPGCEDLDETSRHDGHHFSGGCYVCRGDVPKLVDAVLGVVAPLLADRDGQVALLTWLHAEASFWLALDRDEHESAEQLASWFMRTEYAERRYQIAAREVERLRREVEFEANGADTFAGADAIADADATAFVAEDFGLDVDTDAGGIYISLNHRPATRTEEWGDDVNVDYDEDGIPTGVEILRSPRPQCSVHPDRGGD